MVSTGPVRLVVPAGDAYQPALVEGAARLATRRGLSTERSVSFGRLVSIAVTSLNTTGPRSIEMQIESDIDALAVALTAIEATTGIDKSMLAEFAELASADAASSAFDEATSGLRFTFKIS